MGFSVVSIFEFGYWIIYKHAVARKHHKKDEQSEDLRPSQVSSPLSRQRVFGFFALYINLRFLLRHHKKLLVKIVLQLVDCFQEPSQSWYIPNVSQTYETLQDYASSTTVHGLSYLFDKSGQVASKLFWLSVMAFCSFSVAMSSILAFNDWRAEMTFMSVKSFATPVSEIEFPLVVFCSDGKRMMNTALEYLEQVVYTFSDTAVVIGVHARDPQGGLAGPTGGVRRYGPQGGEDFIPKVANFGKKQANFCKFFPI